MARVRAVFPSGGFGFDGQARRYDGDEFEIEEQAFSSSWMEKLEQPKPKRKRRLVKQKKRLLARKRKRKLG